MIFLWFRDFLRKSNIFKSNLCNLMRYLCVNLAPELKGNIIQYAQYKKIESWPCFDTKKTFALKLLIQFYPFTVTAVLLFCKAKWNNLVEYEVLSHLIFYLLELQRISICPARVIATGLRLTLLSFLLLSGKKSQTGSPEIWTISSLPDLFKPEWTTKGKFSH